MIIACSKEGQLCNRLFHFSHLISYTISSGNKLWYPFFSEYSSYFPNLNKNNLDDLQINIYSNKLIRLLLPRLASFFSKYYQDPSFLTYVKAGNEIIDLSFISKQFIKNDLLLLDGWLFRESNHFLDNAPLIRKLFQFTNALDDSVIKLIKGIKNNPRTYLVGVHVRRGDYAQWEGGRYYFDDEIYLSFIDQISSLFSKRGKEVNFIIFSDESISINSSLLKSTIINMLQKTAIEDLCLMTKCDYIIGPPSSFSGWASFMGEVPLLHIESPTQEITLNQFKINSG